MEDLDLEFNQEFRVRSIGLKYAINKEGFIFFLERGGGTVTSQDDVNSIVKGRVKRATRDLEREVITV